ncbi:hypothetical protein RRG08_056121 [Elysia crispata]|uniref:Uncharacterized protein n=1 Tax=Elysia crispata TaxID=231223 RepID=A0AAE0YVM9_9GAST|nr:hypothetical protein RRG08_056121 [Elysia crispata]
MLMKDTSIIKQQFKNANPTQQSQRTKRPRAGNWDTSSAQQEIREQGTSLRGWELAENWPRDCISLRFPSHCLSRCGRRGLEARVKQISGMKERSKEEKRREESGATCENKRRFYWTTPLSLPQSEGREFRGPEGKILTGLRFWSVTGAAAR